MKNVLPFLTLLFIFSCSKRENIKQEIENMYGRKISITFDDYATYSSIKDCDKDIKQCVGNKLIVYHDSTECSVCELKNMYEWQTVIEKWKASNTNIIMVFAPRKGDIDEFKEKLKNHDLITTVLLDTCYCFIKENPFIAKSSICHTFLVDKNGKIILIGNPCKNKKIEKKLMRIINERETDRNELQK